MTSTLTSAPEMRSTEGGQSSNPETTSDRPDTSSAPRAPRRWQERIDVRQVVRRGLLAIAVTVVVFVAWLVVISAVSYDRSQDTARMDFASELRDGLAPVNQPIETGTPMAVLEIPAIGMQQIVLEGTTADVTSSGPGHLRTSAIPGQPGVSVILGRRATFGGPFGALPQLVKGDLITVTTGQGDVDYKVDAVGTFAADDASAFVADGDALLLVTSDPGLVASGRLVVTALPDGELFERGTRVPQSTPTPAELGLGGDWSAAVGLLVWLEIAALVFVGAMFLARRWLRWPAWVIITPVLVAVVWLVFEQFARLLPATL